MRYLRLIFLAGFFALAAASARAAATEPSLILAAGSARPGDTIMAGIRLRMQPHWHTYWRNPGGSGLATKIIWQLPPSISAGETQWPVPTTLRAEELITYIYENEVVLLVPLKIAPDAPAGPLDLKAKISWLECEQQCVPGHGEVESSIIIGNESTPSPDAAVIATWQKKLPLNQPDLAARASWEKPATTDIRPLVFEWPAIPGGGGADFYPYSSDNYDVQLSAETLPSGPGKVRLRKMVKKLEGDWPQQIAGLLIQKSGADTVAYEVNLPIAPQEIDLSPAVLSAAATPAAYPIIPQPSLALMLCYAFLGGLILNIMPCVLPVIALKILGFVNQGREHPARVRQLGLVYALGVLVSFLALAALVIAVKQAGHRAGWGMQFSDPRFIVVMAVLVTLVALNLFGVFEVNLGGKVMGAAGNLAAREGTAGAFFNGILATTLATPCTAPYLGYALGFAFAQSYLIIVLIFLSVGLGLAAPYVILSWNPALLRLLPKPGAWMEKFKIAMGFPMLATAVWLFDLTTAFYGRRVLWLALFLVMVALAAWIYGDFVQRGRKNRGLALAIVILILIGGYAYAIEDQLRWRSPIADAPVAVAAKAQPDDIDWQPWSLRAIADARAAGHPVLVDFTAEWCFVCQVNRKTSIEISRVEKKLKDINAFALVADYTKQPENISAELNHYGRAGVPLVLVYPANPNLPPEILPNGYLTPGIVLAALDRASATPDAASASR